MIKNNSVLKERGMGKKKQIQGKGTEETRDKEGELREEMQ